MPREPYACKQTTALASFANSIRGKATKQKFERWFIANKKGHRFGVPNLMIQFSNQRYISLRKWVATGLLLASWQRPSSHLRTLFVALPQNRFEAWFSDKKKKPQLKVQLRFFLAEKVRWKSNYVSVLVLFTKCNISPKHTLFKK